MKKIVFMLAVVMLSGVLIIGFCGTPASAQQITELSITYHFPAGSMHDKYIQRWVNKVEAESNGRLKFKMYPGGVLVGAFETYYSIPKGVADIGIGYRYGKGAPFSDDLVSTSLMGSPNAATSTRVVEDMMKKYPEQYAKEWGDNKVLWIGADPCTVPITRKPLRTPEDAKGMEVMAPVKPIAEAWKAMGAKPTAMSLADFVIGLQKGTVDGGITTITNFKTFKLSASVKHCTEFGVVGAASRFAVMNKDKWNALSPDLQKVIENNCVWGNQEAVKMLDEETEATKEWATKEGVQFISPTKEERSKWVAAITPAFLRLAEELDAKGYPASGAFKFGQERLQHYMMKGQPNVK